MLDIKFVKDNIDLVKKNTASRGFKVDIDQLLALYERQKDLLQAIEEKRRQLKSGSKAKPTPDLIAKFRAVGDEIKNLELDLKVVEDELNALLYQLPNINSHDTPIGASEADNKVERIVGEMTNLGFPALDHVELGTSLDLLDIEQGAQVSGARFWYLKNELVELEMALIHYLFNKLIKKGFKALSVPQLVKEPAMFGTGFFPAEKNEIYKVNPGEDDLYLIGTAEVPLISYHANQVLDLSKPKKYFAFSTCFRREAGSYGKDTKGILRGHQFDKIEMVALVKPEESEEMHQELLSIEEEIYQELDLPYHVVNICSGDLGPVAAKKYDIEAWLPGQNCYREITSCSNTTDYQSRRLNIKYKNGDKKDYCHTLNGTAMAMGRTIIALMENYQTKEGSIRMPKVLKSYLHFTEIKKK
ncbi:MAG: serine--tRNA ligase [Patescibacteria group bacterium]